MYKSAGVGVYYARLNFRGFDGTRCDWLAVIVDVLAIDDDGSRFDWTRSPLLRIPRSDWSKGQTHQPNINPYYVAAATQYI